MVTTRRGQHRRKPDGRARRRASRVAVLGCAAATIAASVLLVWGTAHHSAAAGSPASPVRVPAPTGLADRAGATSSAATASAAPTSTATTETSAAAAAPTSATATPAVARLTALVDEDSTSATSVAAVDVTTGSSVAVGARSGMTTASVVKLQLLESLLLQHQRAGTSLSDDEADTVTAMIENSDNAAAESTFWDIGGRAAVVGLEPALGLDTSRTVPGSDDYWGLTTTSASQQIALLRNLVDADSPLDAAGRTYALTLMRHVEADQNWGVSAAAGTGTDPAVKNGWLAVDADGDLWAVDSVGVIDVDGDTVLVAVMTQHDDDYAGGIDRVESLAQAAAAAVT